MFGSGQLEKPKLAAARRTETQSRQLDLGSRIRGHDRRRIGLTYLSNSESTCSSSVDRLISSLSGTMVTRFQGLSVCTHTHKHCRSVYTTEEYAHTHALFGLSRTGAPRSPPRSSLTHAYTQRPCEIPPTHSMTTTTAAIPNQRGNVSRVHEDTCACVGARSSCGAGTGRWRQWCDWATLVGYWRGCTR